MRMSKSQLLFTTSRRVMTSGADVPPPGSRPDSVGGPRGLSNASPDRKKCCRLKCRPNALNGQPVTPDRAVSAPQ